VVTAGVSEARENAPRALETEGLNQLLAQESHGISIEDQHPSVLEANDTRFLIGLEPFEQLEFAGVHSLRLRLMHLQFDEAGYLLNSKQPGIESHYLTAHQFCSIFTNPTVNIGINGVHDGEEAG
jgi:hypothetical protein